jgi:hypothetical protein
VGHPTVTKQTDAGFLKKHGSVVEGRKAQGQAKTTVKPKQPTLRLDRIMRVQYRHPTIESAKYGIADIAGGLA